MKLTGVSCLIATMYARMSGHRHDDRRPERFEVNIRFDDLAPLLGPAIHLLERILHYEQRILHKLERLEQMPTLADLDTAVDNVQGVLTANDARVAALATAVSDAAARDAEHDAALDAEIKRLSDLLAAGGSDPAAVQAIMDKVVAMSAEGVTQGDAIDAATTALANAFPGAPPTP